MSVSPRSECARRRITAGARTYSRIEGVAKEAFLGSAQRSEGDSYASSCQLLLKYNKLDVNVGLTRTRILKTNQKATTFIYMIMHVDSNLRALASTTVTWSMGMLIAPREIYLHITKPTRRPLTQTDDEMIIK